MATLRGLTRWSGNRNREGHRQFNAQWLIMAAETEGPMSVMNCPGLPAIGSAWSVEADSDIWAFCTPEINVSTLGRDTEKNEWWLADQIFSTLPQPRCQDGSIENPLNEPVDVGGSFIKYTENALLDRFGKKIVNSSHERIVSEATEVDANRPTVTIGMNVATAPQGATAQFMDHVNDAIMWGLPPRCVKLSNATWSRKIYGVCNFYYRVDYEFDLNFKTFDKKIPDEGSKVRKWKVDKATGKKLIDPAGDITNPDHFWKATDERGEWLGIIPLKNGWPWNGVGDPPLINGGNPVEYYPEANLFALGVPATL
jgi:hypothetical protein